MGRLIRSAAVAFAACLAGCNVPVPTGEVSPAPASLSGSPGPPVAAAPPGAAYAPPVMTGELAGPPAPKDSGHATSLMNSGENLVKLGKVPAAIAFFRQAVIQHPDSVQAAAAAARIVALRGKVPTPDEYDPRPEPVHEPLVKRVRVRDEAPEAPPEPLLSLPSSGGKTVHVRGYTRKDGTYVRPHMRRAPR